MWHGDDIKIQGNQGVKAMPERVEPTPAVPNDRCEIRLPHVIEADGMELPFTFIGRGRTGAEAYAALKEGFREAKNDTDHWGGGR